MTVVLFWTVDFAPAVQLLVVPGRPEDATPAASTIVRITIVIVGFADFRLQISDMEEFQIADCRFQIRNPDFRFQKWKNFRLQIIADFRSHGFNEFRFLRFAI